MFSKMTKKEDEDLSLLISSVLDNFGYRKEMISFRSKCTAEFNRHISLCASHIGLPSAGIPVGSFGEGVSLSGSDKDVMVVFDDIVCVDKGTAHEDFTVLEADYTNTAPGYTKIISVHTTEANTLNKFLNLYPSKCSEYKSESGDPFVSSTVLRNNLIKLSKNSSNATFYEGIHVDSTTASGPALTRTVVSNAGAVESDSVISVYFYGGRHLGKWKKRTRFYNWPTDEDVKEIAEMEGYIVPVGDKQSDNQNLEWRVCYTTVEKKLVSSLSSVQLKLYVLLKMVVKQILKPQCKAITSYVIKNVVFWVIEGTPQSQFSPGLLINLLQKALYFINHCLENNHFPNYMIPERNLMRGVVCGQEKQNLIQFLSELLHEGGSIIQRIPPLQQCISFMIASPESIKMYGTWRDNVEEKITHFRKQVQGYLDPRLLIRREATGIIHDKCMSDLNIWEQTMKLTELLVPEAKSTDNPINLYVTRLRQCYSNPINSGTDPEIWEHTWRQLASQIRP